MSSDISRGPKAEDERWEFLEHLNALIDPVLAGLGIIWLLLVVVDLAGVAGSNLQSLTLILWVVFVADYVVELVIAPHRLQYIRTHWVGALALAVPAFRFFAALRALRLLRSIRLIRTLSLARILTSTNRGLRTIRFFLKRSRFGLVLGSSAMVTLAGASGIYYFERTEAGEIKNLGDALWWSAMMLTTMGSQFWPQSWEGRLIAWLLAVYAFAVFGYITAALAAYFLRSRADS